MSVTSFWFLAFLLGVCALYFILPKKIRWVLLLVASYVFYALNGVKYLAFLAVTTLSVYAAARLMDRFTGQSKQALAEAADKDAKKAIRKKTKRSKRLVLLAAVVFNFGILAVLKYTVFLLGLAGIELTSFGFMANAAGTNFLLPLGISFYTFQTVGYVIDVYYGKVAAEKSIAKFALFVSFFPQIIQGPISRFDQLAPQLYEPHSFSYDRTKRGLMLVLWGYLKKLVVADRVFKSVWAIVLNYDRYSGTGVVFAMLLYCIELYADFSGGIDISRGVCEILGIELTPNFRQPFYATSISEFWRRWHITLGTWVRDYIFYPLATSRPYVGLQKLIRGKLNQQWAERICASLASILTFFVIGIWHGAAWNYIAYGLWFGGIVAVSNLLTGAYEKFHAVTHISADSYGWKLFMRARTFVIIILSFYLLLPPTFQDTINLLVKTFTDQVLTVEHFNKILSRLVFRKQFPIAVIGTGLMMLVGALTEHGRDVRADIERLPLPVQWLILLAGILFVVVFGYYGPEYDGSSFIYQVF